MLKIKKITHKNFGKRSRYISTCFNRRPTNPNTAQIPNQKFKTFKTFPTTTKPSNMISTHQKKDNVTYIDHIQVRSKIDARK